MAKFFDLAKRKVYPYQQREKNVLHNQPEFKARLIHLDTGESIAQCRMEDQVIFVGIEGNALINIDGQAEEVGPGNCLIGGPGMFSMESALGARLLGIQIKPAGAMQDGSRD